MCDSDAVIFTGGDKVGAFKALLASSGNTPVFAFFYSETCGHCQTLMKYFQAYRRECQAKKAKAAIIFISGSTAPELFREYGIGPVPHTMIFRNGEKKKEIIGANVPALRCAFRDVGLQLSVAEEVKSD
jgi:thiol-disulfide isomerase/thioredoxin